MTDLQARIRSLWRLALRLRRVGEAEDFHLPPGIKHRSLCNEIDSLCDRIERLILQLENNNA